MNEEEKKVDLIKEGIIFEKVPELLTRGHVLNKERISKIEERAKHSDYVVVPINPISHGVWNSCIILLTN